MKMTMTLDLTHQRECKHNYSHTEKPKTPTTPTNRLTSVISRLVLYTVDIFSATKCYFRKSAFIT